MNRTSRLGVAMFAILLVSSLGLLTACAPGSGAATGAVVGAVTGAVIGDAIEHDHYHDGYYYDDPYYYKAGPAEYDTTW